jgi:hypothetical protein
MQHFISKHFYWFIFFITIILSLPLVFFVMNEDHAGFSYGALSLLHGRIPYVDSFDQNYPGMLLIHLVSILLFGQSMFGLRLFELFWHSITCLLLASFVIKVAGKFAAVISVITYLSLYLSLGYNGTGQRDGIVVLFFLLSVYFLERYIKYHLKRSLLFTGFCCAFAFLTRPTYGLIFALLVIWFLSNKKILHKKTNNVLFDLSFIGMGFIFPIAGFLLYYLIIGKFGILWESIVSYNFSIYYETASESLFLTIRKVYRSISLLAILTIFLYFLNSNLRKNRLTFLFAGFACISVMSIFVQGRLLPHYLTGLFLVGSFMGGVVWAQVISNLFFVLDYTQKQQMRFKIIFILLIVFFIYLPNVPEKKLYLKTLVSFSPQVTYSAYGTILPGYNFKTLLTIGDYIKQNTNKNDSIQFWGNNQLIYLFSKRLSHTHFPSNCVLFMRKNRGESNQLQQIFRKQMEQDLMTYPPQYFITTNEWEGWFLPDNKSSMQLLKEEMPELYSWFTNRYKLEKTYGEYLLYRKI